MKFSIIIPTYNSSATIKRCITSIADQKHKDYEVVIVDGNSTDNTLAIINELKSLLPNIQIMSEPDKGIYDAMNKGIEMAQGDWLYFLGSDDYFYTNTTLSDVADKTSNSVDVLYGNVQFMPANYSFGQETDVFLIISQNIPHQAIFYHKKCFDDFRYNLKYKIWADWEINIRLLKKNYVFSYIPQTIAFFNLGGESSVLQFDKVFLNDWHSVMADIAKIDKRKFLDNFEYLLCKTASLSYINMIRCLFFGISKRTFVDLLYSKNRIVRNIINKKATLSSKQQ